MKQENLYKFGLGIFALCKFTTLIGGLQYIRQ